MKLSRHLEYSLFIHDEVGIFGVGINEVRLKSLGDVIKNGNMPGARPGMVSEHNIPCQFCSIISHLI